MAVIATAPLPHRAGASSRWIIGRGVDLSLVIGSAMAGYAYLVLFAAAHVKFSYLWWFWSVGFDGTHIFATATRTFFDREARVRNRRLFFGSLAILFSVGPLLAWMGGTHLLVLMVGAWAYYHVIAQHYGFLM